MQDPIEIKRICKLCGTSITCQLVESEVEGGSSYYLLPERWDFTLIAGWRCPNCPLSSEEQETENKLRDQFS